MITASILHSCLLRAVNRKSQLAVEYAYRFREAHFRSHIFWAYAANSALFEQAYQNMARRLKLPESGSGDVDPCQLFSRCSMRKRMVPDL